MAWFSTIQSVYHVLKCLNVLFTSNHQSSGENERMNIHALYDADRVESFSVSGYSRRMFHSDSPREWNLQTSLHFLFNSH